jgi:hypothetical protein
MQEWQSVQYTPGLLRASTHFFSGGQARNDQLRMLGKFREQLKASCHPMGMHGSSNLLSMCTTKMGTLVTTLCVSTL